MELLQQQGRIREIADPNERIQTIAQEYAANPEGTLIVSPDNASRRAITMLFARSCRHRNRQDGGPSSQILIARQELTGAERKWASRYERGDVLRYARGSQEAGSSAANMRAWSPSIRKRICSPSKKEWRTAQLRSPPIARRQCLSGDRTAVFPRRPYSVHRARQSAWRRQPRPSCDRFNCGRRARLGPPRFRPKDRVRPS